MALDFNAGGTGDEDLIDLGIFPIAPLQALSLTGWSFITGTNKNPAAILSKDRGGGGGSPVVGIQRDEDGITFLQEPVAEAEASGSGLVVGTTTLPSSTWHFTALTYDGSDLKLYLDGLFEGSVTLTGDLDETAREWAIAAVLQNVDVAPVRRQFEGRIEDCRYYSQVLTSEEILTIFTVLGIDGIVASDRWFLDEVPTGVAISGSGVVKDLNGGQNNGTTAGTGTINGADGILRSRRRYI